MVGGFEFVGPAVYYLVVFFWDVSGGGKGSSLGDEGGGYEEVVKAFAYLGEVGSSGFISLRVEGAVCVGHAFGGDFF